MIVIWKGNDKEAADPTSYRPIALLSHMGKMLEKIIANRLKDLANNHKLLSKLQLGAPRQRHCTSPTIPS